MRIRPIGSGKKLSWNIFLLLAPLACLSQTPVPVATADPTAYTLNVSVNEVRIMFHAFDANGHAVTDLKPSEIDVFDDEQGPGTIISLQHLQDRPLHVALLLDVSGSVGSQRMRNRILANQAIHTLLTRPQDDGTVIDFALGRAVRQDWTEQAASLHEAIDQTANDIHRWPGGTIVYEALLSTCANQFANGAATGSVNVILLFSDGDDNASHAAMQTAVEKCRSNNAVVYAFTSKSPGSTAKTDSATLQALTKATGGCVFSVGPEGDDDKTALAKLTTELRSEYLLLYRPAKLRHDGSFHRIILVGPDRVANIVSTPGFYDLRR